MLTLKKKLHILPYKGNKLGNVGIKQNEGIPAHSHSSVQFFKFHPVERRGQMSVASTSCSEKPWRLTEGVEV